MFSETERCRKDSIDCVESASVAKGVDGDFSAAQNQDSPHPCVLKSVHGHALAREPQQSVWFKALMRFGLYLMVAAFVIMGAEVAYALCQLAGLVL